MTSYLHDPLLWYIIFCVYMDAVNSMASPGEEGGGLYGWLYRFCHSLAHNFESVAKAKYPQYFKPQT